MCKYKYGGECYGRATGGMGMVPKDRKHVKMSSSKERTGIFRELKVLQ